MSSEQPVVAEALCLGLDLAWSARNRSGAVALALSGSGTATIVAHALLGDDGEVLRWLAAHAGRGACVIAVDAPLRVPNETGRRPAEADIGRRFARFHAGAHPANRKKLAASGIWRGEAIVAALVALGIEYAIEIPARSPGRWVVEVYPHPATVTLFGLSRVLPYKARPHRTLEQRHAAFRQFEAGLRALREPMLDPASLDRFFAEPVEALKGQALKEFEDRLDALMCAFIAAYAWWWGPARSEVFGTREGGSILVPMPLEWKDEG